MIRCDGCGQDCKIADVRVAQADGHEGRYCLDCHDEYTAWLATCQTEEARLNRILDLFIQESRAALLLKFVPQDLPPAPSHGSHPLVLG